MKKIFECINAELVLKRAKYVSDEIRDRENGLDLSADRTQLRRFGVEDAIKIVAEAEAKWESECCEWKHARSYVNCFCKCNGTMVEHDLAIGFEFCPYCGKPIKIVEVE